MPLNENTMGTEVNQVTAVLRHRRRSEQLQMGLFLTRPSMVLGQERGEYRE